MAFFSRVKESQIRVLSNTLKRCYLQSHNPNELQHSASYQVLKNPSQTVPTIRPEFLNSVRFFAAPVQAKSRKDEKDTSGPRLNEKVLHKKVRLVADEATLQLSASISARLAEEKEENKETPYPGHFEVSRLEALEVAKKSNLDLVEVDSRANPPVCRLMDYHKEKYVRQVKGKEQAKKKSDLTLKKGGCKEVRFLGKTEQKDLKIKADTIKRMMDKGYRVKCMAVGNGSENENLGEVLSRLSSLIEDVALVESGPHVEKKQAYIVVRHVKFGPTKKGSGKKSSKAAATSSADSEEESEDDGVRETDGLIASSTPFQEKTYTAESGDVAPREQGNRYARLPANETASGSYQAPPGRENRYKRDLPNAASGSYQAPPERENRYKRDLPNAAPSASFQAPPAGENRYRRETATPAPGGENQYRREPRYNTNPNSPQIRSADPQSLNNSQRSPQSDTRRSPPTSNYGIFSVPPTEKSPQSNTHRSPPTSDYGIFSVPPTEKSPGKENAATGFNRYKKESQVSSAR